ncbi:ABC transporter permease [Streptomyces catenulae]|uniref:ABC transporter permease n=1 Tax=Streptomyces catenulae TaxID=66875 RepID=A0ABV2Z5R6_9ACTN|nr:ABC transporter permease [Streptomyces catenulae]
MSTATEPRTAGAAGRTAGTGRRGGLLWLVWRQNRGLALGLLALLVVGGIGMAVQGSLMSGYLAQHHIAGCAAISTNPRCDGLQDAVWDFRSAYGNTFRLGQLLLFMLPMLVGLFVGAPLLSRELESGTHKVALTQSVGPLRWLTAKLALPAALTTLTAAGLAVGYLWMWRSGGQETLGAYWYSDSGFTALGPVPVAESLLMLVIGTLVGLLIRRTVAAMVITFGVSGVLTVAFMLVRPYLLPPVVTEFPKSGPRLPDAAWRLWEGSLTRALVRLPQGICSSASDMQKCLDDHDAVGSYVVQHPASHHWPLAWLESGIALVLAAVVTVVIYRIVRRRFG